MRDHFESVKAMNSFQVSQEILDSVKVMQSFRMPQEILDSVKAMQSFRVPLEILDTVKVMQAIRVPQEILNSVKAIQTFRVPQEILDSVKAMQTFHVPQEALDTLKAMQSLRVPQEILDTVKALQSIRIPQEVRDFMKAMQSIRIPQEILDSIKAMRIKNFEALTAVDVALVLDEDVGNEMLLALAGNMDLNLLSEHAKKSLIYLYHTYFLPFLISCVATIFMNHYQSTSNVLKVAENSSQVKQLVRNGHFDKNLLNGYRVVTTVNLKVRESPSMISEVIMPLPLGQLVKVLENSKRSWLHVEIEIDGEILDGWVLRRYTANFK